MSRRLRWSFISIAVVAGFGVMHYFAPLQPCAAWFDLSLLAMMAGAVSLVVPLRFLDIRDRRTGAVVLLSGAIAAGMALNWPTPVRQSRRPKSAIDEFMPSYHVAEYHSVEIHAEPDRVYEALHQTTFADLKVCSALMQLRRAAAGQFQKVQAPNVPILKAMTRPGSGFVPLAEVGRQELVLGLAGDFWAKGVEPEVDTPEEFIAFQQPGSAKSVFNMKIEDAGHGWTRLTTETRAMGTDEKGARAMARYWRVIYPGSATIRQMWLKAIKSRAEDPGV